MDQDLAALIQKFRNWTTSGIIIRSEKFDFGLLLNDAMILDDVGIIQADAMMQSGFKEEERSLELTFNKVLIRVTAKKTIDMRIPSFCD